MRVAFGEMIADGAADSPAPHARLIVSSRRRGSFDATVDLNIRFPASAAIDAAMTVHDRGEALAHHLANAECAAFAVGSPGEPNAADRDLPARGPGRLIEEGYDSLVLEGRRPRQVTLGTPALIVKMFPHPDSL